MAGLSVDPELVEQAIRNEPRARDRLLEQSLPAVLTWTTRLSGPKVDPEDAAHDALMIVWTKLDHLRSPERYGAWLYGIVRRVLAAHRRRAWVKRWVPGVDAEQPERTPTPAAEAELGQLVRGVREALEKLPAKQREVLVLCEIEERTDVEVAEMLEVPLGTVKSRLRLARARFAQAASRMKLDHAVSSRKGEE
jgi:RNA polymerase sigma-70 factor, ECF subfamily